MAKTYRAYAAAAPKAEFKPISFDPGPLGAEQVEIKVTSCGLCHSDLSMLNNDWGISAFPFVGGHEVVGTISAVGDTVKSHKVGQTVGLGWYSESCRTCRTCLGGDQNLCATTEGTIVGRHGGFADFVRCHSTWATPLPAGVDVASAGPLFCGGITVFNPIIQANVLPTHRVGVVGIGGLGHMALKFLSKWGCEVVAFTSESKKDEAISFGAHHAVNSRDTKSFAAWKGALDFVLVTVNVPMDWNAFVECLAPKGRLHFVGAVPVPASLPILPLIFGQKTIGGSPLGSPATTASMLDFCARHKIAPVTETFPMSQINDAFKRLESGNARYRIVLTADF